MSARRVNGSGSRRGSGNKERMAPAAIEVLERVARVLRGTGVTPHQMRNVFVRICRKLPPPSRGDRKVTEIIDAAHMLTLWFRDREFLNTGGTPRPLPLRGRGPSLDRLIRRVNPALPVAEVTRYLVRAGAVRRVRQGYVPVRHALSLRRLYGPQRARALRPLVSILRTLEHNMKPMSEVEGWFEWIAENPSVPVRALQKLDAKLDRYGMNLLRVFDIDMLQEEETRKAGEPTVRLGIGIYRFEDREEQPKAERGRVEVPTRSQRDRRPTPSLRPEGEGEGIRPETGPGRGRAKR